MVACDVFLICVADGTFDDAWVAVLVRVDWIIFEDADDDGLAPPVVGTAWDALFREFVLLPPEEFKDAFEFEFETFLLELLRFFLLPLLAIFPFCEDIDVDEAVEDTFLDAGLATGLDVLLPAALPRNS